MAALNWRVADRGCVFVQSVPNPYLAGETIAVYDVVASTRPRAPCPDGQAWLVQSFGADRYLMHEANVLSDIAVALGENRRICCYSM